jgi:hypothetical protein
MPPRSISAQASRVPARTKSALAWLGFGGPDMLGEPAHQGQIVGKAAQKAHCGMGVQIHQAG